MEGNAVTGVDLSDGTRLHADCYLTAVPYPELSRLLPPQLARHPFFSRPQGLQPSPIVAAHLWLDQPFTSLPHAALLGRSVHWFFNKTHDFGTCEGGFHLALVTSAARALAGKPRQDLLRQLFEEIRDALPEARHARLLRAVVFKERRATFALPGCDAPAPARTPLRNLFLAGDWTDTGWRPRWRRRSRRDGRGPRDRCRARPRIDPVIHPIPVICAYLRIAPSPHEFERLNGRELPGGQVITDAPAGELAHAPDDVVYQP